MNQAPFYTWSFNATLSPTFLSGTAESTGWPDIFHKVLHPQVSVMTKYFAFQLRKNRFVLQTEQK